MAANRSVDIALLHHFPAPRVLCWHNILRGGLDERHGAEAFKRRLPTRAGPAGGRHLDYAQWTFFIV